MVQSLNSKVDFTTTGTSFMGINEYGKIMVGDKAFEFYNDRNQQKYIQIPWEEVQHVAASVMFKGRYIPRFVIQTKKNGAFTFAAKKPKQVLRTIRDYIGNDKVVHSLTFFQVIKRGMKGWGNKLKK